MHSSTTTSRYFAFIYHIIMHTFLHVFHHFGFAIINASTFVQRFIIAFHHRFFSVFLCFAQGDKGEIMFGEMPKCVVAEWENRLLVIKQLIILCLDE